MALATKGISLAPTDEKNMVSTSVVQKKKVLIVDDSKTIRQLLTKIISEDPELMVVAETDKPLEVESLILKHKPDVITLDIHMPDMDGVTLLKRIQPKFQIPTIMISSISKEEGTHVLDALEAGAIDYIQKPQMSDMREASLHIRDRIKVAAQAKIRRKMSSLSKPVASREFLDKNSLIVIGASTGEQRL